MLLNMPRKISDDTKQLMQEMDAEGLSVAEIARRTNVPYSTVYGYTKAKQKGFASYKEYNEHWAKEKGFASHSAYQKHLIKQRGFASHSAYQKHLIKQRGFASYKEYNEHWAKEKGFASYSAYRKHLVKQRGFASHSAYQKHLIKQRGFASYKEYNEHLAKQRKERPENRGLSALIKRRLKELGKNQSWLSKQIGVPGESVSKYVQGKYIPNDRVLERLYSTLEVPYQTLDDLLEEIEVK